ncbi:MAG: ATP-dependent DNA ligase [Actinomycetota bacterium]|nr:ATP-dependent DNA ligase [Actinomycetota bacterium]
MLARLERELPVGDYDYEPKWDGFRAVVVRGGDEVELWSRNGRRLARYFPELTGALVTLPDERFVLDAEIVVVAGGAFDFAALLARLHPASSRVERLRRETPAVLIAFDLMSRGDQSLIAQPFAERRRALEQLFEGTRSPLHVTPMTTDAAIAAGWLDAGGGIDGVVAKRRDLPYTPGKRTMIKVKRERTADCVVAGFRWHYAEQAVGSLLLGLYDGPILRHVGLAASFTSTQRARLLDDIAPYICDIEGHPWAEGFELAGGPVGRLPGVASRWAEGGRLTWVPLRPELVCEVSYEHFHHDRFRHPPRFRRWRDDRDPRS